MNKHTFANRKRRMLYSEKVIGQEENEPVYQQDSKSWLKQRKSKLKEIITKNDEKEVRGD
jgi:hypothetical protein